MSRRQADEIIKAGKVKIDNRPAELTDRVGIKSIVTLDSHNLKLKNNLQTIMLNKPVGYVCSRDGQGSKTIYDLLPDSYHHLKPAGRLDKDSSGLILMTNDGDLANQLTHPRYEKQKVYVVSLDKPLSNLDCRRIETGVELEDGTSCFSIKSLPTRNSLLVTLKEGRNRQIRRTFEALGYQVEILHRNQLGPYSLNDLQLGKFIVL
jgi:23S rRNA pseudouridine2605 synthase